jgi:hypothetical protein
VDPELESIVMKALAPDPEDRYRTALDLQREIDRYLAKIAPTLTMREVGDLASSLFEEDRAERTKTIHSSLSAPRSVPPPPPTTDRSSATAAGIEVQLKKKSLRYVGGVAAVVLVIGGIAFAALPRSEPTAPEAPSSAQPGPQLVSVRVAVFPPEASVMIDGKRYGDNPLVLRVPVGDEEHQVHGVLAGYETQTRSVRFTEDVSIELSLEEVAPPPPIPEPSAAEPGAESPRVGGPLRAPRPPIAKPPPGSPSGRCDPPFYFENGIKQYKPGCL